jgi:hypothetical protein
LNSFHTRGSDSKFVRELFVFQQVAFNDSFDKLLAIAKLMRPFVVSYEHETLAVIARYSIREMRGALAGIGAHRPSAPLQLG